MIALGADLQLGWIHLFMLDNTRGWNLIFFFCHRVYCEDDFAFDCCLKQVEKLKAHYQTQTFSSLHSKPEVYVKLDQEVGCS